jgi:hypothetical protein
MPTYRAKAGIYATALHRPKRSAAGPDPIAILGVVHGLDLAYCSAGEPQAIGRTFDPYTASRSMTRSYARAAAGRWFALQDSVVALQRFIVVGQPKASSFLVLFVVSLHVAASAARAHLVLAAIV